MIDDPSTLALESWQAAGGNRSHLHPQPQPQLQFVGDAARISKMILNFKMQHIEAFPSGYREPVFNDFGKAANDAVDRTGKNIHAANHEHVVGASDDSPFEPDPRTLPCRAPPTLGQQGRTRSPVR